MGQICQACAILHHKTHSDMCTHSDTVICEDIITDLKCNNWDSFLNLGTEEVFETDVVEVWKCQYVMIDCQC